MVYGEYVPQTMFTGQYLTIFELSRWADIDLSTIPLRVCGCVCTILPSAIIRSPLVVLKATAISSKSQWHLLGHFFVYQARMKYT